MNKSDATEMENEIGSQIVLIVGLVPEKESRRGVADPQAI